MNARLCPGALEAFLREELRPDHDYRVALYGPGVSLEGVTHYTRRGELAQGMTYKTGGTKIATPRVQIEPSARVWRMVFPGVNVSVSRGEEIGAALLYNATLGRAVVAFEFDDGDYEEDGYYIGDEVVAELPRH